MISSLCAKAILNGSSSRSRRRRSGEKKTAVCRDDRDLNQHFLRPSAKDLGFYWKGFGFHALRREAITAFNATLGVTQTMQMSGHATAEQGADYTLADQKAQDEAIGLAKRSFWAGRGEGKLRVELGTNGQRFSGHSLYLTPFYGGPVQTRTADLYRVKVAL